MGSPSLEVNGGCSAPDGSVKAAPWQFEIPQRPLSLRRQTGRHPPAGRAARALRARPPRQPCGRRRDGPVVMYGWHTVTAALRNPARQAAQAARHRKRRAAAGRRGHCRAHRAGNGAPIGDRRAADRPTRCIRAFISKPMRCPRPRSRTCRRAAWCWCSTRSPIRIMSGRFSARPRPLPPRPSSPPSGTRRTRPARSPKPPPARSNTCRWSACRTWRAALAALKASGFLVVGLDSSGDADLRRAALAHAARAGARRRGQGLAPTHQGNLRSCRAHRSAGRRSRA